MAIKTDKMEIQSVLLQRNPIEQTVPIPEEILVKLNWKRVVSSQSADDSELHELILELQNGDSDHTWQWLLTEGSENLSKRLWEFENERRESIILYYYGEDFSGKRRLIAVGAIAERVSKEFPYSGYPVCGRMYILNQFREYKLGSLLPLYQVLFCFEVFGEKLFGIHFGTSNPKLFVAANKKAVHGQRYIYVGDKKLEGEDTHIVKAFFLPTERFMEPIMRLREILIKKSNAENELCILLKDFSENRVDETFFYKIKHFSADFEKNTGFSPESNLLFLQLIKLLTAIPVIETNEVPHALP